MPKRKTKLVKSRKSRTYYQYVLPALIFGLVIFLYTLVASRQTATINEIGTVSAMCDPQIVKLQQICKPNKYRYAQYRCHTKDVTRTTGSTRTCQSRVEWLSTIQSECAKSDACQPKSSIPPSPVPSGCQWVTTQCLVAPCPVVLQCASPSPSPSLRPSMTPPPKGSVAPSPSQPPKETPTPTPTPVASGDTGGGYSPKPSPPPPTF